MDGRGGGCELKIRRLNTAAAAKSAGRVRLCATPHRRQPTRLRDPWDFPSKVLEWVVIAFSVRTLQRPLQIKATSEIDYVWNSDC